MVEFFFPRCAAIGAASECAWTFLAVIGAAIFCTWYLWIGLRVVDGKYVWLIDGLIFGDKRPKIDPAPKERDQ